MRHPLKKIYIPAILIAAFCIAFFVRGAFRQTENGAGIAADKQSGSYTDNSAGGSEDDSFRSFTDDSASGSADESFRSFTDEWFRQEVSANPLTLRYMLKDPGAYGVAEYSTDLGVYSEENFRISAALAENISAVLNEFDETALSTENRLTRDVLLDALQNTIEAAEFPYYEEPLRPTTGIQSELPILLAEYSFSDTQDIRDYLEILESIPAWFDSICVYEREKQEQGLFMSDAAAETVIAQCEDFAAAGNDNYLIYSFEERTDSLNGLSENDRTAYKNQNQAIVTQQVLPAFREIADTLTALMEGASAADASFSIETENTDSETKESPASGSSTAAEDPAEISGSSPGSPDSSGGNRNGLYYLPLGTEYYALLVRQSTGSPDSVNTLKQRVAAQRSADLAEIAALLEEYPGLETDYLSAAAPCETPEEMLELLRTQTAGDFPAADGCGYTVKYVDAAMEDYLAPAFYLTSPLDDFSENSIYINSKNGYDGIRLFTTLAHEGFPGHLYQNAYFNSTNPSPVRALFGPAGYSEGWATYAELLSCGYAGLSDETAGFLALEQSAVLSLYATADLYIHSEGWTFADTLDFFSDYGFTGEETIREIYDLITAEPAHYLKYYIGYIEFLDLKEYAKELYGAGYTDFAFHRAVLTMGPAPFGILENYLDDYYEISVAASSSPDVSPD
ncbi:MAG: DUF885 domain-containing protein [Lachnospiraceae bacterium]|nr:DUF885 domain-containing protein [Lachnospiraceae bacterium]